MIRCSDKSESALSTWILGTYRYQINIKAIPYFKSKPESPCEPLELQRSTNKNVMSPQKIPFSSGAWSWTFHSCYWTSSGRYRNILCISSYLRICTQTQEKLTGEVFSPRHYWLLFCLHNEACSDIF